MSQANDADKSLLGFLCRHLVAISGEAFRKEVDPPIWKRFVISGIAMLFKNKNEDHWFFVTAGHAMKWVSEMAKSDCLRNLVLVDYMGHEATNKIPPPFVYDEHFKVACFDEGNGVDFGVYYLRDHFRDLMRSNKVVPLTEDQWSGQPQPSDLYSYVMLGLPDALIDDSDPRFTLIKPYYLPVIRLPEVPEEYKRDMECGTDELSLKIRDSMFYASIPQHIDLPQNRASEDDITGMSGGPVFMFRRDGDMGRYWIVALQSSWFQRARKTRAMPIWPIGHYMRSFVDEYASQDDYPNPA